MAKIVELRQDRALVKSNFDGYKLSLDPIPLLRQNLTEAPLKALPNDEQYSLLHVELFSMQNLLVADPWARSTAYFVNRLGNVMRTSYDQKSGRPEALKAVFCVPGVGERKRGDYNCSMRFVSEKYCVLCDGIDKLYLLETGDRRKVLEWKEVVNVHIPSVRNFMLHDCRLDTVQEKKQISLVLGRVTRNEAGGDNLHHVMHLLCYKWICSDNSWAFQHVNDLEGKGSLYYCAFEPRAESLIVSSNRKYYFRSEGEIGRNGLAEEEEKPQFHDATAEINEGYSWTQTAEELVVKFGARAGLTSKDYIVVCRGRSLNVECAGETLFQSELFANIDEHKISWEVENDQLKVTLIKESGSVWWDCFRSDGQGPPDEGAQSRLVSHDEHPVVNLEAPVEDCDFPIDFMDNDVKIERFHLTKSAVTHTVLLGSSPPLFATTLRPGFPQAIATRNDVDASLWLQQYNPSKQADWSLRHEGNLHAFGYVQASKTQKKFMDCAADFSYAVICETHRHVFLYKSNYDSADGLRNRNGPQVHLGKQHLITLEDAGEVLGLVTDLNVITLLTENAVLYLQVN